MKTFDIALEHLKGIDFKSFDTYPKTVPKSFVDIAIGQHKKYQSDERNTFSNDYYRSMVFEAAIRHLVDIAQGRASYWNVACEIIESDRSVVGTKFEKYNGMDYPKVMFDKFLKYCDELNPQPHFLGEESEVRHEFFMAAYHYIIGENA